MPASFYTLEDRFKSLLRSGLSQIKAAKLLEQQWCAYHFHTVDFNLPGGCDWSADDAGNLTLRLPGGGLISPAEVTTRPPGVLDPVPIPFSRINAIKSNTESLKAVMLDDQPKPAPVLPAMTAKAQRKARSDERKVQKAEREAKVTAWLAIHPDLKKRGTRLRLLEACKVAFPGLGERGFDRAKVVALKGNRAAARNSESKTI